MENARYSDGGEQPPRRRRQGARRAWLPVAAPSPPHTHTHTCSRTSGVLCSPWDLRSVSDQKAMPCFCSSEYSSSSCSWPAGARAAGAAPEVSPAFGAGPGLGSSIGSSGRLLLQMRLLVWASPPSPPSPSQKASSPASHPMAAPLRSAAAPAIWRARSEYGE
jgi:hypothetical protein